MIQRKSRHSFTAHREALRQDTLHPALRAPLHPSFPTIWSPTSSLVLDSPPDQAHKLHQHVLCCLLITLKVQSLVHDIRPGPATSQLYPFEICHKPRQERTKRPGPVIALSQEVPLMSQNVLADTYIRTMRTEIRR